MFLSVKGSLSGNQDGLQARYPPPFNVNTYIREYWSYFDTMHLSALPFQRAAFVVLYGLGACDIAATQWRKL